MHQPLYRDPESGKTVLPWARFHALSSYYGMARLLEDFHGVRVTFNLVPVLLSQLEGYLKGETDRIQDLCLKASEDLDDLEVRMLTKYVFTPNYNTRIKPFPCYDALYRRWQEQNAGRHRSLRDVYNDDEIRDLQIWLSLCFFDEEFRKTDNVIGELIQQGEGFSEADKIRVKEKEIELIGRILPLYRRLWAEGRIEVSTSPFYHPILPLLVDPQAGREANPALPDYDLDFSWDGDAAAQISTALTYMEKHLGSRPAGVWPSEGSLSTPVIELLDGLGVTWTATDEQNLVKSVSRTVASSAESRGEKPHFHPYRLGHREIRIFFRDRFLSDRIGFTYQTWDEADAAQDLVSRLKDAASTGGSGRVVSLILDGENPWEHYREGGLRFLREFYRLVENEPSLRAVTFSEACENPPGDISRFSPGSWINGNFDIWIGDEEDRRAWRLLKNTKDDVDKVKGTLPETVRRDIGEWIAAAQGSDWFWWFGKEHATADLDVFDRLFRQNLIQAYRAAGIKIPEALLQPIPDALSARRPSGLIPLTPLRPRIDGEISHHFEWLGSGKLDAGMSGSVMALASPLTSAMFYGFGGGYFYLRLDTPGRALPLFEKGYGLDLEMRVEDRVLRLSAELKSDGPGCMLRSAGKLPRGTTLAVADIIEYQIPLQSLALDSGDSFSLQLTWRRHDGMDQRVPPHGDLRIAIPPPQTYAAGWLV